MPPTPKKVGLLYILLGKAGWSWVRSLNFVNSTFCNQTIYFLSKKESKFPKYNTKHFLGKSITFGTVYVRIPAMSQLDFVYIYERIKRMFVHGVDVL